LLFWIFNVCISIANFLFSPIKPHQKKHSSGLQAKDGLPIINGSNLISGMDCIQIYEAESFNKQAEIAAAIIL